MFCIGTLASAANLSINLTGATPTFTTDDGGGSWTIPSGTGPFAEFSFNGQYVLPNGSSPVTSSNNTVFVVSSITGKELYTLVFNYSNAGNNLENFDVTVTDDNGTVTPSATADTVKATGSPVGSGAPNEPGGITVEEDAISPTVPEPATCALFGLGLMVLGLTRRHLVKRSI